MKRIYVAGVTAILLFAACENSGSSTVGTYENEDAPSSADKKENSTEGQSANDKTENASNASIDTSKNIGSMSKDSVSSRNKKTQEPGQNKKM